MNFKPFFEGTTFFFKDRNSSSGTSNRDESSGGSSKSSGSSNESGSSSSSDSQGRKEINRSNGSRYESESSTRKPGMGSEKECCKCTGDQSCKLNTCKKCAGMMKSESNENEEE